MANANMVDYVRAYGQKTLNEQWFNDLDGVILAQLAYLDFGLLKKAQLNNLSQLREHPELIPALVKNTWNPAGNQELLAQLINSRRFGQLSWHDWVAKIDVAKEQKFSAVTFDLNPQLHYIAYRGTTATLIDWKEDLNMTFLAAIPSQRSALHYTKRIMKHHPGNYFLGGHSKGGNLAVYVLTQLAPVEQIRVESVYSADGPGVKTKIPTRLATKIRKFIPQASIIGLLLEPGTDYQVITSTGSGFRQHDPYTWTVQGDHFAVLTSTGRFSQYTQRTMSHWLAALDDATKQEFLDSAYAIIKNSDYRQIDALQNDWTGALRLVRKEVGQSDPEVQAKWKFVTDKLVDALVTAALTDNVKQLQAKGEANPVIQTASTALKDNWSELRERTENSAFHDQASAKLQQLRLKGRQIELKRPEKLTAANTTIRSSLDRLLKRRHALDQGQLDDPDSTPKP